MKVSELLVSVQHLDEDAEVQDRFGNAYRGVQVSSGPCVLLLFDEAAELPIRPKGKTASLRMSNIQIPHLKAIVETIRQGTDPQEAFASLMGIACVFLQDIVEPLNHKIPEKELPATILATIAKLIEELQ